MFNLLQVHFRLWGCDYYLGALDWAYIAVVGIATIIIILICASKNESLKSAFRNHQIRNTKDEWMRQMLIEDREREREFDDK